MSLIETLMAPRIGRLALLAGLLVVSLVHQLVLLGVGHPLAGHELTWVHAAASAPAALAGCVLAVKRAHDLDHGVWWLALLSAIYIGLIAFLALDGMTTFVAPALGVDPRLLGNVRGLFSLALRLKLAVTVASVALFWPVLIKLLFYAGTPTANRFGLQPGLRAALLNASDGTPSAPVKSSRVARSPRVARAGFASGSPELGATASTSAPFGRRH